MRTGRARGGRLQHLHQGRQGGRRRRPADERTPAGGLDHVPVQPLRRRGREPGHRRRRHGDLPARGRDGPRQVRDVRRPGRRGVRLWQPGTMTGADVTGAPGTLTWTELITRDVDGAKAFYPDVFGWTARDLPGTEPPYTLWQIGDVPVAGMILMNDRWPAELPAHWMVHFGVDDCDAAAKLAGELGGSVSVPPTDTPAGRFAVLADPQHAPFIVLKINPDYQP